MLKKELSIDEILKRIDNEAKKREAKDNHTVNTMKNCLVSIFHAMTERLNIFTKPTNIQ